MEKDRAIKTEEQWKRELMPEEYKALRQRGTEAPFSGKYVHTKDKGMYRCRACGANIFSSDAKFDSGTGWPSFTEPSNTTSAVPPKAGQRADAAEVDILGEPANRENVELREDVSHGMRRTEVICKRCGSHLGHLFDDGPTDKGGKRFCINSVCLAFEKTKGKTQDKETR